MAPISDRFRWLLIRRRAVESDEGASAVEYALIVVSIAAVVVLVVVGLGLVVNKSYNSSCNQIKHTLNGTAENCSP